MKHLKKVVAGGIVASTLVGAIPVGAATVTGTNPAGGGTVESKATITFTANDGVAEEIIHPTEEGKTIDGDGETGMTGELRIDYVSDFIFHEQEVSTITKTYYADLDSVRLTGSSTGQAFVPNFVQVSDMRGKDGWEGWTLKVRMKDELKTVTNDTLAGSELALHGIDKRSNNKDVPKPEIPDGELVLNKNNQIVAAAAEGKGGGIWSIFFGETNSEVASGAKGGAGVSLTVPGAAQEVVDQPYTTDLIWTLSSEPFTEPTP